MTMLLLLNMKDVEKTVKEDIIDDYNSLRSAYNSIEFKVKQILLGIDPSDLLNVDSSVAAIDPPLKRPIAMAISIACCKAAALHNNKSIYEYISSNLMERKANEPIQIPVPTVSILSR